MSITGSLNRAADRVQAFVLHQVGLVRGTPGPRKEVGFQPSLWTGSFVVAAVLYQVVSGALLLLYYQPSVYPTLTLCGQAAGAFSSAPAAWCSTFYTMNSVPLGGILISTHLYGAYAVILLTLLHLFRGYYVGSYKKAGRELSWVFGTVLLVLVLGMGFTGYLLPYTQLSYNATRVSVTLIQSIPWIGPSLGQLVLGDGTAQGLLSRMFVAHVIILPVGIILLIFAHKRTQLFPRVLLYMTKWGLLYLGLLVGVASLWTWKLPTYTGNLSGTQPVTVPAWYFLWLFKVVDFEGVTPADAMVFTLLLLLFLILLPFIDRSKHLHPRDRPVFLFLGNCLVEFFILTTVWGGLTPGVAISPGEVALRLGPILAINAVAVGFFYRRYRREWGTPASSGTTPPSPSLAAERSAPVADRSSTPGAAGPDDSAPPKAVPGSENPWISPPVLLSVIGLVGVLFLLVSTLQLGAVVGFGQESRFGLGLSFMFLMSAFLVNMAEFARPLDAGSKAARFGSRQELVFPALALFVVVFLLVALLVTTWF